MLLTANTDNEGCNDIGWMAQLAEHAPPNLVGWMDSIPDRVIPKT